MSCIKPSVLRQRGTEKVGTLLDIADYWRMRRSDSALVYAMQGEALAKQLGDDEYVLRAISMRAMFLQSQGQPATAKQLFLAGIQKAQEKEIKNMIPVLQNNVAFIYRREGKRDSAFFYWSEAEKGYKIIGYPYEIWRTYLGIGKLFWDKGDLTMAEEYLQKCYEITSSGNNTIDQGYTLFHLGDFYFSIENYEKLAEIRTIWDDRQATRKSSKEIMELPQHSSMLYLFGQDKADALPRLEKAAAYYRDQGNSYHEAWVLENIGIILVDNGQIQAGIAASERSLQLFQQYQAKVRTGAVQYHLYKTYKEIGDTNKALNFLEKYNSLKDSLRSTEIEENLADLQVQYDTEKKEQLLRIQNLELKQKTQESNLLWAAIILLILLATSIILGFLYRLRANRKLSEQATELQDQKIRQLEQENHLLSLTAMIEGQESERIRVAQDLHDGIGGLLTTVKAHFYAIQEQVEKLQQLNIYQKTNNLIDEACVEVRRISQNMMPRALQLLGLKGAIEDLSTQLRQKGLACEIGNHRPQRRFR